MSANVETMMYVRETPWHGLGTMVQEAPTSADALRLAGLDWTVDQQDVVLESGLLVPGYKVNVRSTDQTVLGIVTDRYRVVQNSEAFAFTDNLIGGDVRYETAGSLSGGRKVWMLAKLPDKLIAGDQTETYMCFSNTHDGSGAIRVCMTPIRVVCNNTLNYALNTAKRSWSVRHTGDISKKIHEARMCLEMGEMYMDGLAQYADDMANLTVTNEEIAAILDELFPVEEDATKRMKENVQKMKDEYMVCWFAPDIAKFRNTAWGALNAMSDMVTHNAPRRQTKNYWENNWGRIMNGHVLMDRMAELLTAKK